ncbi:MAG TPA: sulfide/dihydroorotate dehydrogenase-like FAD/NAD-binding protein [Terriglobales bacterium]|nr:sulfide/dihydroorotate dehydrogenase-like FAD/NAD-binding protein [Terriglobales bacterium]
MFKIKAAQFIAPGIKRFTIEAPRIARAYQPGQFIILRLHDRGERIPLTIERVDRELGTINLVVQSIGKTTNLLNRLEAGDAILDVVGPLGKPSHIEKFGTVVVMGGGVGTAMAYPTTAALKKAENKVISIVGARSKDLMILESEMRQVSDVLMITTDDGTYGDKGFVTDKLKQLIDNGVKIDLVLAVGPIPMMRAVAAVTQKENIPTVVSLNSIMVDGTGMCGGCRVLIDGKSEFACVDGPEFDAHRVDFEVLVKRNNMYREKEKESLDAFNCAADAQLNAQRDSVARAAEEAK